MNNTERYNGFTNRETWATHLWLTSSDTMYQRHRGSSAEDLKRDVSAYRDECYPENETDVTVNRETLTRLLDIGSLWRVDWDEVAAALANEGDQP